MFKQFCRRNLLFAACVFVTTLFNANLTVAADFELPPEFDTQDIDVTTETADKDKKATAWHHTVSYQHGWAEQGGSITQRLAWRLQWEKLVADKYYLVLDGKLRLFGDKDLNSAADKNYDNDTRIRSLYVQSSGKAWGVLVGYQVASLGFMEIVPIADIFSPWDFSEPVFTAPEDARRGQPMIELSRFTSSSRLSLYINTRPETTRYPTSSLYYIVQNQIPLPAFRLVDNKPDHFDRSEVLLRYQLSRGKNEHEFMFGSMVQNDGVVDLIAPIPVLSLDYPRFTMIGAGFSHSKGNLLWKIEAAYKKDLQLVEYLGLEINSFDLALGVEFNPAGKYDLAIEAGRFFRDLPASLKNVVVDDPWQVGARLNKNFLNETIGAVAFISYAKPDPVAFNAYAKPGAIVTQSLALNYKPIDDLILELIYAHIDVSGTTPFAAFLEQASSTSLRVSYHW